MTDPYLEWKRTVAELRGASERLEVANSALAAAEAEFNEAHRAERTAFDAYRNAVTDSNLARKAGGT